jgi:predicted esterase
MAEPDYYGLIGVEKNATLHEIRSKFRAKVLMEHPDKGGDPKKFQMLNKAYNVLTDQEKRRRYDATGSTERSAEEEFVEGFGGGRNVPRSKDLDREAVVNLDERMGKGPGAGGHDADFQEWLRQRDQNEMVLTDRDFMKTALFNAAEMSTKINHQGTVQHVIGSPKMDAYGQTVNGQVQVTCKPRPIKKTIDHNEIVVRMLAVPVDDSMVYADLSSTKAVCLGMSGVGRVEQVGNRIEDLKQEDAVLVMPKPTKYSSQQPIGTARTLLVCNEDDLLKIPGEMLEELTPEQISLTPTVVAAYILLEQYGAKLKPGDSVLLNASHLNATGCAILQLCKLLKLKPLCLLTLPGAPKNLVKGEYGSKNAWQDADSRAVPPPQVRQQYERISEWLMNMGAEEVFADAVGLLRWKDRNQRMLPRLALDGRAQGESAEQLVHCLQSGDKDAMVVVYGHGASEPIDISPPLLAAWGGRIVGFNIARWVHSLTANAKKMMAVMENITKLIRANKFMLDTVLYKVGEDAISDAFSRQTDASDNAMVVLIFPTLQEELAQTGDGRSPDRAPAKAVAQKQDEEDDRAKLKAEWLSLLFTDQSVAAGSPEGPLPVKFEAGNRSKPTSLIVWLGDQPKSDGTVLKDVGTLIGSSSLMSIAWSEHPAGDGLLDLSLTSPEVYDGTWYLRDRQAFENQDLDLLHDVELLGRSLVETIEAKLGQCGLDWKNVVILGFGKGAGIAMYASLLKIFPQQISAMVLFSPIVLFPGFFAEKVQQKSKARTTSTMKLFILWGNKNRSTPPSYRQLLTQAIRKAPEVQSTPDTLPDGDHIFDSKCYKVLTSLLPLCLPR